MASMSMASMPKKVRHTIGERFYVDIDMVNAHPVILAHLCDLHDIEHDYLTDYIENREERLTELDVDREQAKKIYLTIINGKYDAISWVKCKKTLYLKSFAKEVKAIRKALIEAHADEFKKHKAYSKKKGRKDNFDGSFMNVMLCDKENEILHKMLEYFSYPSNAVLCFDGLMVPHQSLKSLTHLETYDWDAERRLRACEGTSGQSSAAVRLRLGAPPVDMSSLPTHCACPKQVDLSANAFHLLSCNLLCSRRRSSTCWCQQSQCLE